MKTGAIDWDEHFNHSTSVREMTIEFAEREINGKEWMSGLWPESSKQAAQSLIKTFGVRQTRSRALRWLRKIHDENGFLKFT